MDVEYFIRDREYRLNQYKAERVKNVLNLSLDFIALIRLRIQKSGLDYNNFPFTPYSKQYAERRKKIGRQTKYVDFTVTGRMLASLQPTVTRDLEGTTEVVVKASNQTEQNKLNYQQNKPKSSPRGNILTPTEKEKQYLAQKYFESIQKYL